MADTYNVFISWSGERSERVAKALYDWLPMVLQTVRPWMSKEDIEKGSRGLEEVGKALEAMSVGIVCLTHENVGKPWIHFEAGALSKTMGDKTRVCPYLFGGLRVEQVGLPLGIFQAARAEKEETRKMVLAVNRALGGVVDDDRVDAWFEREWPALEEKLKEIPAAKAAAPHVDDKTVMAEVLRLAQAGANSDAKLRDELRSVREILAAVGLRLEAGPPRSAWTGLPASIFPASIFPASIEERLEAGERALAEARRLLSGLGVGATVQSEFLKGSPIAAGPEGASPEERAERARMLREILEEKKKQSDGKEK